MNPHPPPIAETFACIIEGLCKTIAARAAKTPLTAPIFILLWGRLRRLSHRLAALVARVEAGRLRPSRPPDPGRTRPEPPRADNPKPRVHLPGWHGWVLGAVPGSASFGGYLRQLLMRPDMAALLDAAPQAARMLRPLCHMLGIEPWHDLPPSLFRPKARRARANRLAISQPRQSAATPRPPDRRPPEPRPPEPRPASVSRPGHPVVSPNPGPVRTRPPAMRASWNLENRKTPTMSLRPSRARYVTK